MEVVNDSATAQVEEILAHTTIAGASTLPPADMGQIMFHCHPFTKFRSSLRCQLPLSQSDEQGFIRMNADAAAFSAGSALGFQRTLGTSLFGEVDGPTRYNRHFLLSRTSYQVMFPIERERLPVKVLAFADRPGFAVHFQLITALAYQVAT